MHSKEHANILFPRTKAQEIIFCLFKACISTIEKNTDHSSCEPFFENFKLSTAHKLGHC